MRFLIVGQGSIGSMIGVRLKEKGHEVYFVVRNPIRLNIIEREGIVLFEKNKHIVAKCDGAYEFNRMEHPVEVEYVILATKSYDTMATAEKMKSLVPDSAHFITIQNGITPHIEVSKIVGEDAHLILSLYDSAFSFSLNQVRLTGRGRNVLTSFKPTQNLDIVVKIFKQSGFDVKVEKDAFSVLYTKLFINAVINPITTILRVKNGELIRNQYAYELVKAAMNDVKGIAKALNLKEREKLENIVIKTIEQTSDNKSSMLQDIEWKRKTEIDDILGYTIQLADDYDVGIERLKNLYFMVKAIESQYLK